MTTLAIRVSKTNDVGVTGYINDLLCDLQVPPLIILLMKICFQIQRRFADEDVANVLPPAEYWL